MNLSFATTIVRRIADFHTVLFAWLSLTWDSCVADWYKLRLHAIWPVWVVTEPSVVSQGHWLYVKLVSRTCNAPSLAEWNKWIREQANCCAVRCASSKRNPFSPENNIIIQRKTCRFTISLAAFISIKYPLSLWNCCRSQRLKTGVMFENSSRLSECIYIRNLGLCWKVATMRQGANSTDHHPARVHIPWFANRSPAPRHIQTNIVLPIPSLMAMTNEKLNVHIVQCRHILCGIFSATVEKTWCFQQCRRCQDIHRTAALPSSVRRLYIFFSIRRFLMVNNVVFCWSSLLIGAFSACVDDDNDDSVKRRRKLNRVVSMASVKLKGGRQYVPLISTFDRQEIIRRRCCCWCINTSHSCANIVIAYIDGARAKCAHALTHKLISRV